MFCKKCGKQVQDDSMFCKYCGNNDLNNTQPIDRIILKTNVDDTSATSILIKNKSKNTSVKIINLCFIVIVLLASIFFIPFKQHFSGVVRNETFDNVEYRHFFNLPGDVKDVWIKPPGRLIPGKFDIKYNLHYLEYCIRFIIIVMLYLLIQAYKLKLFISKSMSLKNIVLTLYIILFFSITIIFTPYVKFAYSSGKLLFTGERGFYPLFRFNDLMEVTKNGNIHFVYNIDFRVLLLEVVVLTVIFLIIYLNIRNKAKD
jgi:RNA polymerase subunit RPABC4/transcription elongation factor Spt4